MAIGNKIGVENGYLVPMISADGELKEVSLPAVGHEMQKGAKIVDHQGNLIPPKEHRVRWPFQPKTAKIVAVDPGPQYSVCFAVESPGGHLAMVTKVATVG